jgi:RNA polymerase subunit RPABC4/transcription elongation factor Spt4
MNDPRTASPQGSAAPILVLCRQCIRYVHEGTTICPHCGGDSHEISDRYREGGYLAIETIQRIARTVERRRG